MSCVVGRQRSAPRSAVIPAVQLLAVSWAWAGCSSAHSVALDGGADLGPFETADVGTSEPDECYWGAQFADCGGSGTPRFACPPTGLECRWFTGGVVAEGFLAWPCADGRICCEEGPDARYPHGLDIYPASFFNSYGAEPWTRQRSLVLDVSMDPQLSGEVDVQCERDGSPVDDIGPCLPPSGTPESANPYFVYSEMHDTLSVTVYQVAGFGSEGIAVEIMLGDTPDALRARVCQSGSSDGVVGSCEPSVYPSRACATEGSIRLSNVPTRNQSDLSGVVVAGDVVFPSGLEVSFTVPL